MVDTLCTGSFSIEAHNLKYLKRNFELEVYGWLPPLIEELHMDDISMRVLVPKTLPTVLNYLNKLDLYEIRVSEMVELSWILSLIRISPNLQKLHLLVYFLLNQLGK